MFPEFMNDILGQARCGHCDAPQTIADIRVVGVRPPEEFEAFRGEPVFIIIMGCKNCGQWTNHTMRRSRAESVEGIVSFIQMIERDCEGKKPPLNIPGLGRKTTPAAMPLPDTPQPAADATGNSRPRPSRRKNQPDTPPTQREIQAFLHRLRKTSFRRKSKGFSKWMKEFGADAEDAGHNDGG
jgi:hypothetical protein